MSFFVHPQGICESPTVGEGTRIWAFAHVLPKARIGADCNICDNVFIENDVVLGDRVTVKCGVQLWDGIRVGDDVFIGPNVTFSNDPYPRSKKHLDSYLATIIEKGASLGANSTVLPGIRVGAYAMVGAGTVLTTNVPPYAIIKGNPGRITGYVETETMRRTETLRLPAEQLNADVIPVSVEGVNLYRLQTAMDMRGKLAVGEFDRAVPFSVKRFFIIYDVPSKYVRGEHAHRLCHQFLIAVQGNVSVVVDDGRKRMEVELDQPNVGLHVPPMIWATQYRYSPGSVLLVLASEHYDASDYIRNYEKFLELKGTNPAQGDDLPMGIQGDE